MLKWSNLMSFQSSLGSFKRQVQWVLFGFLLFPLSFECHEDPESFRDPAQEQRQGSNKSDGLPPMLLGQESERFHGHVRMVWGVQFFHQILRTAIFSVLQYYKLQQPFWYNLLGHSVSMVISAEPLSRLRQ